MCFKSYIFNFRSDQNHREVKNEFEWSSRVFILGVWKKVKYSCAWQSVAAWLVHLPYVRVYAIIGGQLFLSPGQIHLLSNGLKPWSLSAKFPINVLMLSHKLRQKASLRSIQFRFFVLGRVIIAFRKELISQQREISSLTFQPLQHI